MPHFRKHHLKPWGLEIVNKYPLIFLEEDENILCYTKDILPEDRVNLRYGFEHDEGWAKLVEELADTATQLVEYLRKHPSGDNVEMPYIHGFICKEKFGRLTWQGTVNLPEPFSTLWYSYVGHISSKSMQICEVTGEWGMLRSNGGWVKTLCDEEAKKRGYDKDPHTQC